MYGQLVMKWRLNVLRDDTATSLRGAGPLAALADPWVISGFAAAAVAALFWLVALSRLPLSTAYPFMSTSFVLVLLLGSLLLGENVGVGQIVGIALICCGLAIGVML